MHRELRSAVFLNHSNYIHMENYGWKTTDGKLRMENYGWKTMNGKLRVKVVQWYIDAHTHTVQDNALLTCLNRVKEHTT